MAGGSLLKSNALAALAASLGLFSLPALAQDASAKFSVDAPETGEMAGVVLAQAEGRGPGGRGGWRDNAGNGGGGGNWRGGGNGGGWQGRGGWSGAQRSEAPQAAPPVAQQAPQGQSGWSGRSGGNWQSNRSWQGNAGGNGGGEWRGRRGAQDGSRWGGNAQPVPQAQAPQQTERSWQGGNRQTWRGEGQNGGRGDQWRGQQGNNQEWRGRTGNNSYRQDGNRWSGNNRNGYNNNRWGNDNRRWDRDWRRNDRYNWSSYRSHNRNVFRLGSYYSPYRNYSYSRLSIGFYLDSLFYSNNYWINDTWQYRLPEVYGPYR